MSYRFKIYVADSPLDHNEGEEIRRLIPENCRRQERGLGSAGLKILSKTEISGHTQFDTDKVEELKRGQWVRIVDSELGGIPSGTIFLGYITDIVRDVYVGTDDYTGSVTVNEIGHYYAQVPVWNVYRDQYSKYIETPPVFNPVINGFFYANKTADGNKFKTIDIEASSLSNSWGSIDLNTVWSRANIISLVTEAAPFLFYDEHIESTSSSDGDKNDFLASKKKPESFPNYQGKSIIEALDDLIEEPLSYYFDYWSSLGVVQLIVFSKSKTQLGNIPAAAKKYTPSIRDTGGIANFTVTSTQHPVDHVVVRGKPIVCCASMTPWTALGGNTLKQGWTANEQLEFVRGYPLDEDVENIDPNAAEQYRKQLPNVYQKFDFYSDWNPQARILRTKSPGSAFTEEVFKKYPFCPRFAMKDDDNKPVQTPLVYEDLEESNNNHSNPNPTNIKFANELPIEYSFDYYVAGEGDFESGNKKLLKPQVWAYTKTPDKDGYFYNLLEAGVADFKSQLDYHPNGFILKSPIPQLLAWNDDTNEIWRGENDNFYTMPSGEWEGDKVGKNPDEEEYVGKTHWGRLIFTVAIESDQHVETSRSKQILTSFDPQGNPVYVDSTGGVRRIIETDHEVWWVAEGTVLGSQRISQSSTTGFVRTTANIFTRNDLPLVNELADVAFQWLTQERSSISVEYQMMNIDYDNFDWCQIGNYIEKVTDRRGQTAQHTTWSANSCVTSVEYIFNEDAPRIIVSTEIPTEPLFKKLLTSESVSNSIAVQPASVRSPLGLTSHKLRNTETWDNEPVGEPVFTQSTTQLEYHVWQVTYGKSILPAGVIGIRRLSGINFDTLTLAEVVDLNAPGTLEDGVGVAVNVVTGAKSLVYMGDAPIPHDLWEGMIFIAYNSRTIKITGTGTDPISNPARYQEFLIPLFVN